MRLPDHRNDGTMTRHSKSMRIWNKDLVFILLLIIVGTAVYANTLSNLFVYDDQVTVEDNLFIRDWRNLGRFLTGDYYLRSEEYSFRPLVTLTYFGDFFLGGENPPGYHLTNLLLHLLSGLTLYFLVKEIVSDRAWAWLAALIFIIHPVQTEAVGGISFREDLLCALFFLLSLLMYISSERRKKRCDDNDSVSGDIPRTRTNPVLYSFSLLFFLLALLSKEMAVTLPLVIVAYEMILRKRRPAKIFQPKIVPFFSVAFLYLLARFLLLYHRGTLPAAPEFGNVFTRLFLVFKGVGLYGRLAFFPIRLTVEYPDPFPLVVWSNYLLLPALLTIAFLSAVWIRSARRPAAKFGLAFFIITLLPVLNLVPNSRLGAERFAYLPMLGFSLWGAVGLSTLLSGSRKKSLIRLLICLILLLLAAGTVLQNRVWRNNLTLFRQAVAVSPLSSKAHHGLGNEYFRLGKPGPAASEFQKAIAIFNREPLYYNSLGVAYGELGRFDDALNQFQASARLNPGDPLVLMNLSTLFLRTGNIPRAREEIDRYIAARPFDPSGFLNLGEINIHQGEFRQALAAFRQALEIDPGSVTAREGLGYCYYRLGEHWLAEAFWRQALELDPDNPDLKRNLKIISPK
ncbi:MAG: tetratricopeptide repeat protein [Candidatus Euphemobacter frigidus]|nr:tetratricopeptide repeat protein [Candidatus Euphemobacter frigidus]MDP8275990.1 tetratricopeptide repeat protein [Candidatus Euphemobacter frigidus]